MQVINIRALFIAVYNFTAGDFKEYLWIDIGRYL